MNNSFDISQYNPNYSHEFSDTLDKLNLHINLIYNELKDIYTAIYIFEIIQKQWEYRGQIYDPPEYSTLRTTLYESLVYRIIIGLSKIFANKDNSLIKAVNQLEQQQINDINVKKAIKDIQTKYNASIIVGVIRMFRDKFFAHLDNESILSELRINPEEAIKYISISEIADWMELIHNLYATCFNDELPRIPTLPTADEILTTFKLN